MDSGGRPATSRSIRTRAGVPWRRSSASARAAASAGWPLPLPPPPLPPPPLLDDSSKVSPPARPPPWRPRRRWDTRSTSSSASVTQRQKPRSGTDTSSRSRRRSAAAVRSSPVTAPESREAASARSAYRLLTRKRRKENGEPADGPADGPANGPAGGEADSPAAGSGSGSLSAAPAFFLGLRGGVAGGWLAAVLLLPLLPVAPAAAESSWTSRMTQGVSSSCRLSVAAAAPPMVRPRAPPPPNAPGGLYGDRARAGGGGGHHDGLAAQLRPSASRRKVSKSPAVSFAASFALLRLLVPSVLLAAAPSACWQGRPVSCRKAVSLPLPVVVAAVVSPLAAAESHWRRMSKKSCEA